MSGVTDQEKVAAFWIASKQFFRNAKPTDVLPQLIFKKRLHRWKPTRLRAPTNCPQAPSNSNRPGGSPSSNHDGISLPKNFKELMELKKIIQPHLIGLKVCQRPFNYFNEHLITFFLIIYCFWGTSIC